MVERIVKDMRIGRTQHSLPLARGGGREALGGDCCAGFDAAYPLSRGSDSSPFQKGSQKNAAPFAGARPRAPRRPANMHAFWLRRRGDPCGRPRGTILVCRALWRIREETGILSLCLSQEKEAKRNDTREKRNDTREGKIAISSPPETHPNSNAQEGRSPLGSPPGGTHSPGVSVSPRFPRRSACLPLRGRCRAATVGAFPPDGDKPRPYMGTEGFRPCALPVQEIFKKSKKALAIPAKLC